MQTITPEQVKLAIREAQDDLNDILWTMTDYKDICERVYLVNARLNRVVSVFMLQEETARLSGLI